LTELHVSSANETAQPRESMEFDVLVVGAGPAGLAAAIRLKQKAAHLSVVVIEKGPEVGAHILSGAVIDPVGLDALLPEWRGESDAPLRTPVREDRFNWLSRKRAFRLPSFLMPPLMNNHGNYIASLGEVCRWLAAKAEALGVEIFPGFAGAELLYNDAGSVIGVATGDMGRNKAGAAKAGFQRGMALYARYTLLAEGARGSLSKQAMARYDLTAGRSPQKFGLGLKELWEVVPEQRRPGLVQHSFGWPLDNRTGGGSFLYHLEDGLVSVGFVVHLDYANPHLSPFDEFQRFKTHPAITPVLKGGRRLSYGARAIAEGGWQAVPKLVFPGGALVGCAAGFVNVPRIKGSHNAILSGIAVAEVVAEAIAAGRSHDELSAYEDGWRNSQIGRDLRLVRNVKPLWSRLGTFWGVALAGFDMWCNTLGFSLFGTLQHRKADYQCTRPALETPVIDYPRPDGMLTFDRLSSVFVSGTAHDDDQPVHLRVTDPDLQKTSEHDVFGGPSTRYCPAGVYEWIDGATDARFQINSANCVHCKTCDIKDPNQNITWTPPEGGGGPSYRNM
jgi:electron-transferring-flavoprotein dehydrogenase